MIEYVLPHSPDDRILEKSAKALSEGKLICFPTDTNWVIACSIQKKDAIEKLGRIKEAGRSKHFALISDDISKASEVAHINNQAFRLIKKVIPGHYTFIFEATKKISKLVQASKTDKEVALRFPPSHLVKKIIETHGDVVLSTNIPKPMLDIDESSSEMVYSYQIEDKMHQLISMIIDPGEVEFAGRSTVISFCNEELGVVVLREGAGDPTPFI